MNWDKKRIDYQVYKEKGKCEFLITFGKPFVSDFAKVECFAGLYEDSKPNYNQFCHCSVSLRYLSDRCYPISQKQLKKFPEWYEFFNHYLTN